MGLLKAYNRQKSRQHKVDSIKGKDKKFLSTVYSLPSTDEKGVALVMVLVLAAISLLIMAALLYMITSSTQISGMQKRYKSGLEAGIGGAEIAYQVIATRGEPTDTASLITLLSTMNPIITTPTGCSGTDRFDGTSYTGTTGGLEAKLMTPTASWTNCNSTMSIDPNDTTSYDMQFDLGTSPNQYRVYAKIVDTVQGVSSPDYGLGGKGVDQSDTNEVRQGMPYLYTMEMDAQAVTNPSERAKLSILYQY